MPRKFLLCVAVVLAACACTPAEAQEFRPKGIVFKGAPEYSDQELLAAAGLRTGATLSVADMNGHFKQLMDTGMFDNVLYKFDGVDLIFQLTPATLLYTARFENLPLAPDADIAAQLHARLPLYHGKVPSQGGMLDGVQHALEEVLAAQGIKATVGVTPFNLPGAKAVSAMSFAIDSPPVLVGAIELKGVSPEMQAKAKAIADHATGDKFDAENSGHNLEDALQSFYVDNGYAAAKVSATRAGAAVVTGDAIDVPFQARVEEGKVYKLGSVRLSSNDVVGQAEVDKAVLTFSKNFAVVRGLTLRNIWAFVSSRYKSKGYLDCTLTPHPEFDDAAGVVNYTVDIVPGPVYHLAFIKFDNVSDDLRKLLMRNWQMLPGDVFDASYVGNFIINAQKADPILQRTLAGVRANFDVRADPQTHDVNVVMRLERAQ
jgi:outer membrane protein assembly factor BamA